MRSRIIGANVLATVFVLACDAPGPVEPPLAAGEVLLATAPADGNGNKNVVTIDVLLPDFTRCPSGATLDLHILGWFQERQAPGAAILPANFEFTFSNDAGETYVWRQAAVQRFYFDENGNLVLMVAGRLGFDGLIGRLVVDPLTGTVLSVAGREVFAEDLACAALS